VPQAAALSRVPRLSRLLELTRLSLVTDLSPAGWIVGSLTDFAKSVNSIVPRGFTAYVRVFHPAYRRPAPEQPPVVPVRWAEIAATNGTRAHAGMQLCAITGSEEFERHGQPGIYQGVPEMGNLPRELIEPIVGVLGAHTEAGDLCWFAFWHGWGGFEAEVGYPPTFATPGREYILFSGAVDAAIEDPAGGFFRGQSASIWWPDDHAWCVATEVDFKTTYIGCSEKCSDDLLACAELEAYKIDPAYGIDWRSDRLNSF
jgi:hypothetical protein